MLFQKMSNNLRYIKFYIKFYGKNKKVSKKILFMVKNVKIIPKGIEIKFGIC